MEEEVKGTEQSSQDTNTPVNPATTLAVRTRADIYGRFDKQFMAPSSEPLSDTSSVKEESATEPDSTESSDTDSHSENVVQDSEKSTSVKKGKDTPTDTGDHKLVPLQALHESRDRFKKLNLEYREYKESQEKELKELKDQLAKLSDKLKSNSAPLDDELGDSDEEKQALRREIMELKRKYESDQSQKVQEQARKAQEELLTKISKTAQELAEEGYRGFDMTVYQTEAKLRELLTSGELTENEVQDPSTWKRVYKEHVFPSLKGIFEEAKKKEILTHKKEAKKKANLVSDPGKAPEKEEKSDDSPISYNDFIKSQVDEMKKAHQQRMYKRRV